ncbi:hypothetical protein Ssi03_56910 [Sphaerisporangium siamense]|nr:hypothetical protein Ssi03_56910 [Sphaerisporangium siamense]
MISSDSNPDSKVCQAALMWLVRRRPKRVGDLTAEDAVRRLMALGFIGIRSRTHLVRRELESGSVAKALDCLAEIRRMADVCHNLPADLRPGSKREREARAVESIKFHLRELEPDDQAAQWVRECLDALDYDYLPLLPKHVQRRLQQQ